MVELVEWLHAQLDTDAARAQAAAEEDGPDWQYDGHAVVTRRESDLVAIGSQDFMESERGAHIVRWDPARVLREINAKRQLLQAYERAVAEYAADGSTYDHESEIGRERTRVLGEAVRFAALAYSTRPGYAEAVASLG